MRWRHRGHWREKFPRAVFPPLAAFTSENAFTPEKSRNGSYALTTAFSSNKAALAPEENTFYFPNTCFCVEQVAFAPNQTAQEADFPAISESLRPFAEAFDWEEAKAKGCVLPRPNTDAEYDEAQVRVARV
eukprot:2413262-Pleurochrysis_carterae.AAC.1